MKNNTTKVLEGQKQSRHFGNIKSFMSIHDIKDINVWKENLNTGTDVLTLKAIDDQGIGIEIIFFLSKNSGREE